MQIMNASRFTSAIALLVIVLLVLLAGAAVTTVSPSAFKSLSILHTALALAFVRSSFVSTLSSILSR
jgi:hypothetical protein